MGSEVVRKKKSTADFWRAMRFITPYWRLMLVSIVCAFFCAAAATSGLGTLLPICSVLFKGDTIPTWAQREIAAYRLGVRFSDDVNELRIVKLTPGGVADRAGLRRFDVLSTDGDGPKVPTASLGALSDPGRSALTMKVSRAGGTASEPLVPSPGTPGEEASPVLNASLQVSRINVLNHEEVTLALPPLPPYLIEARKISQRFPTHPVKAIALVLGLLACLSLVANFVDFFQEYFSDKVAILAVNDIRRRLYDHILHVPLSHFNLSGTSDVTSRLVQDAQGLQEGYKTILGQTVQEPIKAAMAFSVAIFFSWKLTIFVVLFAPIMLAVIKKMGKKMRRASKKALMNSASMLGQIEASLHGIRVVKGATAERFERRRYTRIMDELVEQQLRMSRIDSFTGPSLETLTFFVVCIVVIFASYMVCVSQTLSIASFIVVMACLASMGDSLRRVSKVNNTIQKASAAAGRIFEIISLPIERSRELESPAPSSNGNGAHSVSRFIKLPPLQREVRFENVTFTYPGSNETAVEGVNLVVPKGKCIAIVGRNGSGKTTLLALLPRFYDPQEGRILIDGIDIRDAALRSLRRQISIVTQDSVIFPGTIAQNIAYGNPLAGEMEIHNAAARAFAHDFILQKTGGYGFSLGGLGGQLSGGQKQRLCIARAIFREAPILILDEATSQVDAESEQLIQKAIDGLLHERTTFVIAHRFSTIRSADSIVVMDRGRIVGQGSHEELLRTCEIYEQLYEGQITR
jgi:subfamily B ATP-binding cassette protein MsbA